jgi:hypothetical protein
MSGLILEYRFSPVSKTGIVDNVRLYDAFLYDTLNMKRNHFEQKIANQPQAQTGCYLYICQTPAYQQLLWII